MSKNKYLGVVAAVALLFMLLSLRLYNNTLGVWTVAFWIIAGILAMIAGGFAVFAVIWLACTGRRLIINIGTGVVLAVTLLIWVFYWVDYDLMGMYGFYGDMYESYGFMGGSGYADAALSSIVTALGIGGFYYAGAFIVPEQNGKDAAGIAYMWAGLFMCAALLIAGYRMPLMYITLAVLLGLGMLFFRSLQKFGRLPLIIIAAAAWLACLAMFIVEMAAWGYEINFALLTGIVGGIVYAVCAAVFRTRDNRPAPQSGRGAKTENRFEELAALRKLKDAGILSEEEFQAEKKKILGE